MKTIIQVPVEKKLRDQALKEARRQGFSSLQDLLRLFLEKFVSGEISVRFVIERPSSVKAKIRKNAKRDDKTDFP